MGYVFKSKGSKVIIRYNSNTSRRISRRLKNLKNYDYDMYLKSKASYNGFLKKCNTSLAKKMMNI